MAEVFDAIVVGAGPAGSAAALVLARAGKAVCLLERGPFPGSKNLYGGVIYPRVLDGLLPRWRDELPVERWVTRRTTMALTRSQALSVDLRTTAWGSAPYNGATALRPKLDAWLAAQAEAAGASLVCSTTATGLITDERGGAVRGVRVDRPGGDIEARVVIACDGVNAFLAREAGCAVKPDPGNFTLGVKEVLAMGRAEIDKRFALEPGEGADLEIIGCTGGVPGGGFLYTNRDSVAVGLVLRLPELAASGRRPEEILADLKAHPADPATRRRRGPRRVRSPPHPRGGLEHDAEARHRRDDGGRGRGGDVPRDRDLARGRELRDRLGRGGGRGGCRGALDRRHQRSGPRRLPAPARGELRARRSQEVPPGAPPRAVRPGAARATPSSCATWSSRCSRSTTPSRKPGLFRVARRQARRSGLRLRHLARDAADGLRSFG